MNTEQTVSDYPHRRRPWIAVLLSLLMPGLGQIYCGDMVRGIVIILVMTMFSSLWAFGMMMGKGVPVWSFFFLMWGVVLLATVIATIDAYRRARRTRFDYQLKEYNHWGTYLAILWIGGAGTIGYTAIIKQNMFEAFRVPSHSMAPNIAFNDRVIANKLAFRRKSPQRGDVVLFDHPDTLRGHYVKRVVALGGDTVEIRDGELLINGQILERTRVAKKSLNTDKGKLEGDVFWETNGDAHYQIFISDRTSGKDLQPENFGPVTVPEYQCFVMGDNRNLSFDSRNFGSLSIGALRGKFKYVYWPLAHRSRMDAP